MQKLQAIKAAAKTVSRATPGGTGIETPSLDQMTHEIRANPGTSAGVGPQEWEGKEGKILNPQY
jgi:hypothetical protein